MGVRGLVRRLAQMFAREPTSAPLFDLDAPSRKPPAPRRVAAPRVRKPKPPAAPRPAARPRPARPRRGRNVRPRPPFLWALALTLAALLAWAIVSGRQPGPWQHVLATREGMIGARTSTGLVIRPESLFVALPHRSALGRQVEVRYGARAIVVPVLDVGPWNIDDPYWEQSARPAAERGLGVHRRPTNRAGIDLSDAVFTALGLRDNDLVEWRFVHRGFVLLPRL